LKTPHYAPAVLPENVRIELSRLYAINAPTKALEYLKKQNETLDIPEITSYLHELERLKSYKGSLFTTHTRLKYLPSEIKQDKLIIIDEDPLNTFIGSGEVNPNEIKKFIENFEKTKSNKRLSGNVNSLFDWEEDDDRTLTERINQTLELVEKQALHHNVRIKPILHKHEHIQNQL
jgi:hypothetical protein